MNLDSSGIMICECCKQLTANKLVTMGSMETLLQYIKLRRWGFRLLIRLNVGEKHSIQKFIVFCVGIIISIAWVDSYVSDIKAFIEFRTDVMKSINFTGFDNVNRTSGEKIIPNYIHYIRLEQQEVRWALTKKW